MGQDATIGAPASKTEVSVEQREPEPDLPDDATIVYIRKGPDEWDGHVIEPGDDLPILDQNGQRIAHVEVRNGGEE